MPTLLWHTLHKRAIPYTYIQTLTALQQPTLKARYACPHL